MGYLEYTTDMGKQLANKVSDMVNCMLQRQAKEFCEELMKQHPSIQQLVMSQIIKPLIVLYANPDRMIDARNRASHDLAVELLPIVGTAILPHI